MDDADTAIACILADCATADDLRRYIRTHAIIVQYLVSCAVKDAGQSEAAIKTLYAAWADMAVEQLEDPRVFPGRKPH